MNGLVASRTTVSHFLHPDDETDHSRSVRWDPSRENDIFFDQSAILYAYYYQTQILIHRSFIPKPDKPSPLSFPSLAICANAARSCSHVVDAQRRRGSRALYLTSMPAFSAGIVLLVNIWGAKKARVRLDLAREMADVHKCMDALLACQALSVLLIRFPDDSNPVNLQVLFRRPVLGYPPGPCGSRKFPRIPRESIDEQQ